jgi:hypothetical protein
VEQGLDLVTRSRFFTIWSPRQTGKSTYFRLLAEILKEKGYRVLHINVENFVGANEESFLTFLANEFKDAFGITVKAHTSTHFYDELKRVNDKKAVYDVFYPYANGESKEQINEINLNHAFMDQDRLDFDKLVAGYRTYVKRRGFRYFREKDENGQYKQIKEAALVYSFESFIQTLLQVLEGKSYLEPHSGQGRSDLVINIGGQETVIEFKIYRDTSRFEKGKKQVAHYAKSLSLNECVYLVFVPDTYKELGLKDETLTIDGVTVRCYVIYYDEEKDF